MTSDESAADRHERRRAATQALQEEFDAVEAEGHRASERGDADGVQRAQARKRELVDALNTLIAHAQPPGPSSPPRE